MIAPRSTGTGAPRSPVPTDRSRPSEQLLALLLAHYTCDAVAQTQEPLGADRLACVETDEEVKSWFARLDPAPIGTPA